MVTEPVEVSLYLTYNGLKDKQTTSIEADASISKETVIEQSIIKVEDQKANEVQNKETPRDVPVKQVTKEQQKQSYGY